jgi:hypothetical protein
MTYTAIAPRDASQGVLRSAFGSSMTIRAFAHSTRGISPQPDSSGCDEVATEGISSKGS